METDPNTFGAMQEAGLYTEDNDNGCVLNGLGTLLAPANPVSHSQAEGGKF
eukprot:XP_001706290.1 Hypothetical protein GL50803_113567 [Giardia lamblia ATCC 50803]